MNMKAPKRDWFVGVHVNATSLIDEGVEPVLEFFRSEAGANTVLLAVHGFNPEIIDRPERYVGHGGKGPHRSAGGFFAVPHPEYYCDVPLGDFRVRDAMFDGFDILAATLPAARSRGMSVYVYLLESASTGGRQVNIPGFARLLEIDVSGRRSGLPCINNPGYRAWKLALVEDLHKSYEIDGFLWGVERWGPLHKTLIGEIPTCFCPHCQGVAKGNGLDYRRVTEGYRALWHHIHRGQSAPPSSSPQFIELLRTLLSYPEIVAWERLWTDRYLALHRELYGVAKWIAPKRPFGLGLWHYYFIDPLLRAEWDLGEFAESADFIRPILYHLPEGPRIRRYLNQLAGGPLRGFGVEELLQALAGMLGMKLPRLDDFSVNGLPAEYVAYGIHVVRQQVGRRCPIYAGIGVDVVEEGLRHSMSPVDVEQAVQAAAKAGADGITVSRNYAEMQIENVKAIGRALRRLWEEG